MKVIVIVANGWNASWLGCYGNEWVSTPNIDQLAAESIVFDQHFVVRPSLEGFRSSIVTSRYEFSETTVPLSGRVSLFQSLRQYGVKTIRVHNRDERSLPVDADDWDESIVVKMEEDQSPGATFFKKTKEILGRLAEANNWLLWLDVDRLAPPWSVSLDYFDRYAKELMDGNDADEELHPWDDPPLGKKTLTEDESERLHATFAAVVTEWDAELGRFFKSLKTLNLDQGATWLLTSGHGLSLGEHNWIGVDAARLFEEVVHVPLILRLPGAKNAGRRVPVLSATIDIMPTLFDIFGLPAPREVHGASLMTLAAHWRASHHPYIVQVAQSVDDQELALRNDDWACLLSANDRLPALLFRKPEDRWEVNDVRHQHLEWAEHLEATLKSFGAIVAANHFSLPELKDYEEVVNETDPESVDDTTE